MRSKGLEKQGPFVLRTIVSRGPENPHKRKDLKFWFCGPKGRIQKPYCFCRILKEIFGFLDPNLRLSSQQPGRPEVEGAEQGDALTAPLTGPAFGRKPGLSFFEAC